MKTALAIFCLLSLPSCAYWHWWRGDEVEVKAADDLNNRYTRTVP